LLDPAKLADHGIPQPFKANPEQRQQRPGRTAVAIGQPDVGGDPPVPPGPPGAVCRLASVLQHP